MGGISWSDKYDALDDAYLASAPKRWPFRCGRCMRGLRNAPTETDWAGRKLCDSCKRYSVKEEQAYAQAAADREHQRRKAAK